MLTIKSKAMKALAGLAVVATLALGASPALATSMTLPGHGVISKASTKATVMAAQQDLNEALGSMITPLIVDGAYGAKTTGAARTFQKMVGITQDGLIGPITQAKLMAAPIMGGSAMVPGCTSTTGFSSTTGMPCTGTGTTTSTVPGCTSTVGFSSLTGAPCNGSVSTQTGPITVALSANNPASGYIIGGQATADLAHFTFNGTGTVSSLTLQRGGISDQNTLTNVYLYDGMTRLTDGYSFNNTGTLTMNNLGLMVSGSRTISVKADVATLQNASSLKVTLVSFTTGTTVSTVNISGNEMTYGTGILATVYLPTQASVAVPNNPSLNAGTSAYTVWSAPVAVNLRTVQLKGANFRIIGSAPAGSLSNIHMYVDGADTGKVATMGIIGGTNYAMFDFSAMPVNLTTGSHTVDVRADIVSGASYTVQVSLQQAADLVLFDPQVGVNIAPAVSNSVAFTSNNAGTLTIAGGTASVTVDPAFQSMTNITGGATNTAIGKFKVHGYGEDVKVTSLAVLPVFGTNGTLSDLSTCTANTNCSLNNVSVYFNGSQVGSSLNWNGTGVLSFNLGSQLIIPAGVDSTLEIRADLQNAAGLNYTAGSVSAKIESVGQNAAYGNNAQGQSSHTTISFPGSEAIGTTLTIQTGLLAVSKNTAYSNQSVTPNTAGVKIGSFTLQNQSSSESVNVTGLTVGLLDNTGAAMGTGTTPALTNFSNLRTSETSGSGSTPVQPSVTNTFSVNFTMLPGTTKTIDVYADTNAAVSTSFSTKLTVTSVGASSHVSIGQNGTTLPGTAVNGQTITLAVGTVAGTPTLLTASSTSQQFVPAGTTGATDATVATFKLTAANGSATISELKFTVNSQDVSTASANAAPGTTSQAITVTSTTGFAVGDVVQLVNGTSNGVGTVTAVTDATHLQVYVTVNSGGTLTAVRTVPATVTNVKVGSGLCGATGVVCASPVNGVAYLTGLNLTVPNGGAGLSLPVYISYAPVGTNGVQSGATSRVALESVKYNGGNSTTTLATTALGGTGLTAASAPLMKLVASTPAITVLPSSSVSNGSFTAGTEEVGQVTVTATKGAITLKALPINLTLSSAQLTAGGYAANGLIVKDSNGNPVVTTNTAFSGTTAGGTSTISFGANGYQIDTTQTFKIFAVIDTTNFNGAPGTVVAHSASATFGLGSSYTGATAGLIWVDTAGNASAATGTDVIAGTTINGGYTAVGNETTISNKFFDRSNTPGFFYNYPTTTVSLSS